VGTFFKVAVVVFLIAAVAAILLTPSPQDDVLGVLHKAQLNAVQPAPTVVGLLAGFTTHLESQPILPSTPGSPALLDLVCVRLC
jgi:hypothetical protein